MYKRYARQFCKERKANRDVRIEEASDFRVSMENICGRTIPVLCGSAEVRKDFGELYRICRNDTERVNMKLIPYFAWPIEVPWK